MSGRFVVAAADNDDNSVVWLHTDDMEALQLFRGDLVMLDSGKPQASTLCVVLVDDACPRGSVKMNKVVRDNLRVVTSGTVSVQPAYNAEYGRSITVLPLEDTMAGFSMDQLKDLLLQPTSRRPIDLSSRATPSL